MLQTVAEYTMHLTEEGGDGEEREEKEGREGEG